MKTVKFETTKRKFRKAVNNSCLESREFLNSVSKELFPLGVETVSLGYIDIKRYINRFKQVRLKNEALSEFSVYAHVMTFARNFEFSISENSALYKAIVYSKREKLINENT